MIAKVIGKITSDNDSRNNCFDCHFIADRVVCVDRNLLKQTLGQRDDVCCRYSGVFKKMEEIKRIKTSHQSLRPPF